MVLDFEYGINTGNRFLGFVDHDEDPEEFIARQTQPEEKPKKSTKETKPVTSTTNKKATNKPTTTTTTPTANTTNVSSNTTKTNKENLTGKSTNTDQRRQQTNVLGDNNNQQTRMDSGRGGGRGFSRRGGGSAGQDRPPYEGGNRGGGGGQQRSQRFHKFEGPQATNETSGFEQGGDAWKNETGNDNQTFSGYRGRGRGGPRRGNFEGGRGGGGGGGRGRGRGGRGNFNNRNFEEGSQQQQQTQESGGWQQSTESNTDNTRSQSAKTGGQELDTDVAPQERQFEPDNTRRGGRGHFRSRTFHNNRNYGSDRPNQYERGSGEGGQDEYRHNRRQHDRQPRTNVSTVKPVEKKDGEGAHNWGNPTENPDEHPVSDEITETTGQTASIPKDWAQQVDEAEKQMTLDEYKKQMTLDEYRKQLEAKKRAHQEKLPQLNRRVAGEGVDPKDWQNFKHQYRKKNENEESNEEELEEGSGAEENESGEEIEEEPISGKKKIITIPLRFKPIEIPRGPAGSRGGPRRGGGGGRYRDRPNRDDQPRSKSPSQQQQPSSYQQTGEYQNDEQQPQQQQQQQSRPYRGGSRQGSGRGEYRRSYGNSARGSRGSYNRANVDPNTIDLDNALDFPTLPKQ